MLYHTCAEKALPCLCASQTEAERDGKSHLQARCDAFASGHFLPSGRSKIALASVTRRNESAGGLEENSDF